MDAAAPDAADAAGMAESAAESAPSRKRPHEDADPQSFWKAQLEAIYARRNPMKVDSIPDLLQKYRGKEAVLYAKVCHKYDWNPKKFHIDPQAWLEYDLMPGGVSAGSSLTLIQEPDAEFVEFQQRFMPEPLEAVPEAVHVVWCETWERVFGGQRDTVMLGAFRCPRKAREAVLEEASEEYHQVMNAEFRGQGSGEECLLSSSAKSMCLSLADSEHHKRWRVESTNLIGSLVLFGSRSQKRNLPKQQGYVLKDGRRALEAKKRRIDAASEDVANLKAMFEDLKAQHAAERPAFEQELAELKEQNRQVQAAASAKWDAARKAQVSLRRAEEQGEQLAEEFLVRQRQLEQQNLRLRKALSALKTRLFGGGWKQTKRRLVTRCEPSEERPSISPASLWLESAALESSNRSAAGLTPRPGTPKSPAASLGASLSPASRGSRSPMRASRGNTPRSGSRRPDDEHAQMRECLRNAEDSWHLPEWQEPINILAQNAEGCERARQAQAELAAAQARLTALEQRQRSLEPKEERTGSSSKQEKGTEVAGEAHPEWRAEPEDPGDLKHTTPTSPDEKSHGLSDTSPSSPPVPWAGSASTSTRSSEFR
eukprot:g31426.t1